MAARIFADFRHYTRLAIGLSKMLRTPVPSDPEEFIRRQLANREQTFLDTVRRAIFSDAAHPYHVMFRMAGCEFGDLAENVRRHGLDATLTRLRREGVYLAHDEWKGRQPIVRGGREIAGGTDSFRNPLVTGWVDTLSSGSSGRPVKTSRSSAYQAHVQVYHLLRAMEFRLFERAHVVIRSMLPNPSGIETALRARRIGVPLDHWFSLGTMNRDWAYRAVTDALVLLGNLQGARAVYPHYLPPNDFSPVAQHVARRKREGRTSVVQGIASPMVRVAASALDNGYDIAGTVFWCGGEALTPGKRQVFHDAGCESYSGYVMSEVGHAGMACHHMVGSCVHMLEDSLAAITHRRPAPFSDDVEVDSLHFTTLLPYAPNIFINIEMEDEGVIEPANCDCVFSRLGFSRRINHISSFGKMSPQGMTFTGTDLVRVLEEELPARLGGKPGDYQLVECEGRNHQTELRLHVSRHAAVADTDLVRSTFIELMRGRWGGVLATRAWVHSDGIEVSIAEPYVTATGKVHAVRLLGAYSTAQTPEPTHAS